MDLGLKGKIAVVSGSTAGIGFAIGSALAAEGAHVVLNGRTEERVTAAVDSILKHHKGAQVRGVAADLGKTEGIFVAPEGAACLAALKQLRESDWIKAHESVTLFNTGSGIKYLECYEY